MMTEIQFFREGERIICKIYEDLGMQVLGLYLSNWQNNKDFVNDCMSVYQEELKNIEDSVCEIFVYIILILICIF